MSRTSDQSVLLSDDPRSISASEEELENARERIVSFIADLVDDAGSEGAVPGLSGGIDSTLTAHLAVEALGEDGLHGITMPAEVNDPDVMSDAERVAHDLGIEYDVVEIQPIAESVFRRSPRPPTTAWRRGTSTSGPAPC